MHNSFLYLKECLGKEEDRNTVLKSFSLSEILFSYFPKEKRFYFHC